MLPVMMGMDSSSETRSKLLIAFLYLLPLPRYDRDACLLALATVRILVRVYFDCPGTRHSLCKTYSRILQYQPQSVDSMTPATVSLPWKGEWRNSRCVCCKWHKQSRSIPSLCICKTNQNKTKSFNFLVEEARLSRSVFNMPLTVKEPFHIFKETKN